MAATEELRVLIKTVADTSGASQAQQSLNKTEAQAASASRALTSASTATRSAMSSLVAYGAAAIAAQVSVEAVVHALGDTIQVQREHERVVRATTMAYGESAAQYIAFAQKLSAATGFTSDAILEAALSARTLSQNYGLSIEQTQKLISVSADLARVRGIGIAEAFERVQSAIRGEAEASEYLGLTLNDTFLTNQAMNGSLKNTFGTMTDLQKAQVRYNELLKQSAQFAGLATQSTDSLDGAFNRAGTSAHNLQLEIGQLIAPAVLVGLQGVAAVLDEIARTLEFASKHRDLFNNLTPGGITGGIIGAAGGATRDKIEGAIAKGGSGGGGSGGFGGGDSSTLWDANRKARDDLEKALDNQRRRAEKRLFEINEMPELDNAAATAKLAFLDQMEAALEDLVRAQLKQVDLQHESVALAAEEARIKMSLLPAQERMAELQRQVTEQEIHARQAALPSSERLEDLQYEQQRLQLLLKIRGVSPEERSAARRQLREIARGMPAAELEALVAGRGVTLAGRAAERVGLQSQLLDITNERALAGVNLAQQQNALQTAITNGIVDAQQQVWDKMVQQVKEPIQVTINITDEDGTTRTITQLIEANQQAQTPPIIQNSGVRRN